MIYIRGLLMLLTIVSHPPALEELTIDLNFSFAQRCHIASTDVPSDVCEHEIWDEPDSVFFLGNYSRLGSVNIAQNIGVQMPRLIVADVLHVQQTAFATRLQCYILSECTSTIVIFVCHKTTATLPLHPSIYQTHRITEGP
jgi:hypothetical protein